MELLQKIYTTEGRLNRLRFLKCQVLWTSVAGACMLMTRRLHDLDKNGGFFLVSFIPVVGLIFMAYLFFAEGTVGRNKFGKDPLAT